MYEPQGLFSCPHVGQDTELPSSNTNMCEQQLVNNYFPIRINKIYQNQTKKYQDYRPLGYIFVTRGGEKKGT